MNRKPVFLLTLHIAVLVLVGGFTFSSQQPAQAATLNDFINIEWTNLGASALHPRGGGVSEAQAVVVNNKLYVFGGYSPGNDVGNNDHTPTREIFVFDPNTETWSERDELTDMPKGLTHGGFTTDSTDIYYAGGYPENATQNAQVFGTKEVWRYNVADDNYTRLPDLPVKNAAGQLIYVNGKLHYLGGTARYTNGDLEAPDLPDHYIFDLEAYKTNPNIIWQDITAQSPLPNPRHHASSAVIDGMVYYLGGQKAHDGKLKPQNDVHRLDPITGQWTQMADIPTPQGRNHAGNSTVVLGGRIIVMAGQSNVGFENNTVFGFDPIKDEWTTLTSLPMPQHSGVGAAINGVLYFGMGDKNNGASDRRAVRKGVPILVDTTATPTSNEPTSTPGENTTATANATATSDAVWTDTPSTGQTSTPDENATATANAALTETPSTGQTNTPDGNATATANVALTETPSTGQTNTPDGNATATANATATSSTGQTSTPDTGIELLIDGSFEVDLSNDKLPDAWSVKNLTSDKMKCNKPGKTIAYQGECAFQFRGSVGENARLHQKVTTGSFAVDDTLTLSGYVNAGTAVVGKLQATVKYSDNTPKTKITITVTPTTDYQFFIQSDRLASGNVAKIKVQVRHNSPSGKMRVDAVSLRQESAAGLLPLPAT